jgi:hypothetical protein
MCRASTLVENTLRSFVLVSKRRTEVAEKNLEEFGRYKFHLNV